MTTNGWTFVLAMFRDDGSSLGRATMDVDWEPARQWTRHVALCNGRVIGGPDGASVQPLWHHRGEPYLRGFRVVLRSEQPRQAVACDFPTTYFHACARALSSSFVQDGALSAGDTMRYVPLAVQVEQTNTPRSRLALVVQDVSPAQGTSDASLAALAGRAANVGEPIPGEIPVVAPQRVLDDIVGITRAAGTIETGGALVGHVLRDPALRQVFVEVTGQVPALHTEASTARLLFTADTWRQLQQELVTRARGEAMVGWWHSHPVHGWCSGADASADDPGDCAALRDCFSELDCAVHRTVFPAAHCVALVVNNLSAADVKLSVYGWHHGELRRRGLHSIGRRE